MFWRKWKETHFSYNPIFRYLWINKCYKKFPIQHLPTFSKQAASLFLSLESLLPSSPAPVTCTWLVGNCWEPSHKPQNTSTRQPGKAIACHCTGCKKRLEKMLVLTEVREDSQKHPPAVSREYYCFMKGCQVRGKALQRSCFHCVLVKCQLIATADSDSVAYIFFQQFVFMILVDPYFLYILIYLTNIYKNYFLLHAFIYQNLCFFIKLDTYYDKHNEGDSHVC